MTRKTHIYLACVIAAGLLSLAAALWSWESKDLARFICYAGLAAIASALKVRLPGIEGTYSADYLFILLGVAELGLAETVMIAAGCAVVQSLWKTEKRPTPTQVIFNVANMAISASVAYKVYHLVVDQLAGEHAAILLPLAAAVYFVTNTLLVSGVLAMLGNKPIHEVWHTFFLWSFPYYLIGSSLAVWMADANRHVDWRLSLLVLPLMYLAYISYKCIVRQFRLTQAS